MEREQPHESQGAGQLAPAEPDEGPAMPDQLLTPGEVAELFGVDPKTVSRWADAGKLEAMRTLGGHRRYRAREVHALLDGD